MSPSKRHVFRYIDLFAGAGGLALGFRWASDERVEFRSVFAVEIEPSFAASYVANFGDHVFRGPIEGVERQDLPAAEIVIGGPPCQGFSPLGRMSPADRHPHLNRLWRQYFKVVEWVNPLAFVIENVPEFLKSAQYVQAKKVAEGLGYKVEEGILNAADFGVPQLRRRGFVIGVRRGTPCLPDARTRDARATVRNAIGDLVDVPLVYNFQNGGDPDAGYVPHPVSELHIGRNPTPKSIERYKCVPPGGNRFHLMKRKPELTPKCWLRKKSGSTDVFGRLEWNKPALTIRTEFFKPEKGRYLHPQLHRPITHWEAARIQSFPDNYTFCGSKTEIARQIGNAVPPKLAQAVAETLKEILLNPDSQLRREKQGELALENA